MIDDLKGQMAFIWLKLIKIWELNFWIKIFVPFEVPVEFLIRGGGFRKNPDRLIKRFFEIIFIA